MFALAAVGLGAPFAVLALILVTICSFGWRQGRSEQLLHRWAARNGLTLISFERRWLVQGPYWWRGSRGQVVFRVDVSDSFGHFHRGWVRVGSLLFGVISDEADVVWDEPDDPTRLRGFPVIVKPPLNENDRS